MGIISRTKVLLIAHEKNFKHVKYINRWKEYKVYEAYNKGDIAYVGLPQIIIVDKHNQARWANEHEVCEYLDY